MQGGGEMKVTLFRKQTPHEGVTAKICCRGMNEIAQGGAEAAARGQMGNGRETDDWPDHLARPTPRGRVISYYQLVLVSIHRRFKFFEVVDDCHFSCCCTVVERRQQFANSSDHSIPGKWQPPPLLICTPPSFDAPPPSHIHTGSSREGTRHGPREYLQPLEC